MPNVVLASQKNKIDGSIKAKAYTFLQKLQDSDTTPGLHIEPIKNAVDPRVRTGRVDDFLRAVLFRIDCEGEPVYYYVGTFPHDDAIAYARRTELRFNLALGVRELLQHPDPGPGDAAESGEMDAASGTDMPDVPSSQSETAARDEEGGRNVVQKENLLAQNWDQATLESIGISGPLAGQALAAHTQAELARVLEDAPETQALVLLGLACGESWAAIKEELGISETSYEREEQALAAEFAGNSGGFTWVGANPDSLREALESSDINKWRVFLHPEQRRYAEGSWKGPYRLSGGAGTGKTVVLLHRARALHRKHPGARILLTTYTRTLADSLRTGLELLAPEIEFVDLGQPGVCVKGIDQIAAHIINHASKEELAAAAHCVLGRARPLTFGKRLGDNDAANLFERIGADHTVPDQRLLTGAFLASEYDNVILPARITSLESYLRVPRPGRGTPLSRPLRKVLWEIFDEFRSNLDVQGVLTYPEVVALAAQVMATRGAGEAGVSEAGGGVGGGTVDGLAAGEAGGGVGGGGRNVGPQCLADHILVDEAQDFHALHWQLLRASAPEGSDDLFIAEDAHQRIYRSRVSLAKYGINIRGRSRRLRLNYRTTAENLAWCINVLEGGSYLDLEDQPEDVSEYKSVRSGPAPRVIQASRGQGEIDTIVNVVRAWIERDGTELQRNSIAVLTRSSAKADAINRALPSAGIASVFPRSGESVDPESVVVMTMHQAKGLEFRYVIVAGAGADELPSKWALASMPEGERDEILLRERSLLYVAASRARDELVVTTTAEREF